jgi:predicted porin
MKTQVTKATTATLLTIACAGAYAEDGLKISGYVDTYLENISNGQTSTARLSSGGLNNSRVVFSGEESLGGGNKAFFQIEKPFAVADSKPRQTYVGLGGAWGDLSLGRLNTPSYWIAGYADPAFSADHSMVNNMQFFYAQYRASNAINYNTPSYYGFKGRFMYSTGADDGTKNGRYLSTGIEYREGALYAGAVTDLLYTQDIKNASQIHSSRDNYFSLTYKIGGFEPSLIYHTYNGYYSYPPYVAFQSKGWDFQVGGRWQISFTNSMFFSFVHKHDDFNTALTNANGMFFGGIHALSKRTSLYVTYAHIYNKHSSPIRYPISFSSTPATSGNPGGWQLGIRHIF